MNGRLVSGVVGAALVLSLVGFGIAGLVNGFAAGALDELLTPTAVTLAVVIVAVVALAVAGSNGGGRLETPYW